MLETIAISVAVIGGLFCVLISLATYKAVTKMTTGGRPRVTPVDADESQFDGPLRPIRKSMENLGFVWAGAYIFEGNLTIPLALWQRRDDPATIAAHYAAGQFAYNEFVTLYEKGGDIRMLTTSGSKESLMLPFPSDVRTQAFTRETTATLWAKHRDADELLTSKHFLKRRKINQPLNEVMMDAVILHIRSVRKRLLWPLRGPWWYFGRRNLLANRRVK